MKWPPRWKTQTIKFFARILGVKIDVRGGQRRLNERRLDRGLVAIPPAPENIRGGLFVSNTSPNRKATKLMAVAEVDYGPTVRL